MGLITASVRGLLLYRTWTTLFLAVLSLHLSAVITWMSSYWSQSLGLCSEAAAS